MSKNAPALVEEYLKAEEVLGAHGVGISMDSSAYYLHLPNGEHWTVSHEGLVGIVVAFDYLRGKDES